jgi:RND family efflux transporter MFP subunit
MRSRPYSLLLGGLTAVTALTLGCDGASGAEEATGTAAAAATATAAAPAATAAPAARSGGSVVLSSADLLTLAPTLIEEGVALSGGLRPIETLSIRARLEGDVLEIPVREGDAVTRGELLARFESTEQEAALRSAEADRLAAAADSSTATWDLEQTRELFAAGAVPERDLRAAEQQAAAAQARLAAADARLRSATLLARDTRVLAPVAGVIERRNIERGVRAQRGAELFTLVRTDVLELTAAVPARRAGGVQVGQAVRFNADGRSIQGTVARISPTIDPASQSVTVYVQVPNRDGALRGNTFATGQIIERSLTQQLAVPQSAIRQPAGEETQPFVWRLTGGALERAVVRLGIVDEARGFVQVLDGLAAGDQVVVGNVGMLGVGMQVQLIGGEGPPPAGGGR